MIANSMTSRAIWRRTAALCALLATAVSLAQYQVNHQIYGSGGTPRPQTVRYLYGPGQVAPTSGVLPSEYRNQYFKSGALPSEVRMGYAATGPMDPRGPTAYIPPSRSYTRSTAGPVGNQLNTNVSQAPKTTTINNAPFTTSNAGSVHFSSLTQPMQSPRAAAPSAGAIQSQPFSSSILNAPMNGSIRYGS
ncbi:MAG: hypothetical protein ACREJC_08105 [Tepidisphaeraceae bacterium]